MQIEYFNESAFVNDPMYGIFWAGEGYQLRLGNPHRDGYPEMNKPWKVTITYPEWRKPPDGYTIWWDDVYFWMKDGERSTCYPDLDGVVKSAKAHAGKPCLSRSRMIT